MFSWTFCNHSDSSNMDSPEWGTRCHGLHQGTWHGRWRASTGGDWAEQMLQLARLRNGRPVCLLHGCHQRTWPLMTSGETLMWSIIRTIITTWSMLLQHCGPLHTLRPGHILTRQCTDKLTSSKLCAVDFWLCVLHYIRIIIMIGTTCAKLKLCHSDKLKKQN